MIHLYDFEDSFTYNIYNELLLAHIDEHFGGIKIHSWKKLKNFDAKLIKFDQNDLVVLGPGPGHPSEYFEINDFLKYLLFSSQAPFFFGVCLGHQLIWEFYSFCSQKLNQPIHGQSLVLKTPEWTFFEASDRNCLVEVQRYNSLYIPYSKAMESYAKLWIGHSIDSESQSIVWGSLFSKGLTYQFHPESVGTSCPSLLFRPLINIRYNNWDGCSNRRPLRQKND